MSTSFDNAKVTLELHMEGCPFCDDQPKYEPAAKGPNNEGSWPDQIIHSCPFLEGQILVRGESKEDVFKKWNTRA